MNAWLYIFKSVFIYFAEADVIKNNLFHQPSPSSRDKKKQKSSPNSCIGSCLCSRTLSLRSWCSVAAGDKCSENKNLSFKTFKTCTTHLYHKSTAQTNRLYSKSSGHNNFWFLREKNHRNYSCQLNISKSDKSVIAGSTVEISICDRSFFKTLQITHTPSNVKITL